ncbi:MAG: hypothetical protein SGJ11_12895 [Phycisphaerae bacterium]|nr:hypothetical protein [Phycisphaerae bacterium]
MRVRYGMTSTLATAALTASVQAFGIDCPGTGDCCVANFTPGCNDQSCCNAICSSDPACCQIAWDQMCADAASKFCSVCPAVCGDTICEDGETWPECPECPKIVNCPGVGDCCDVHPSPGCTDASCCNAVCAFDPSCCTSGWDQFCVNAVDTACGFTCGPVCGDTICEEGETFPTCPECPEVVNCPGVGDCCEVHPSPGCTDATCCDAVCAVDPSCCESGWDQQCVNFVSRVCAEGFCGPVCGNTICEAGETWPTCPECPQLDNCPGAGDCCEVHPSSGCNNAPCCTSVCAVDPSCCSSGWDQACVNFVASVCERGFCGPVCGDTICEPGETFPACPECEPNGSCPATGDCCEAHANPGCADEVCCEAVCALDPSCCNNSWDSGCVALADQQDCGCDGTKTLGDLDGDGVVGANDLGVLLGAWGSAGGPADLDNDGTVGSSDLAILLGAWS